MGEHYIEFKYCCDTLKKEIIHRIDGDSNVEDLLEGLEDFMKGVGYAMHGKEIIIKEKDNG